MTTDNRYTTFDQLYNEGHPELEKLYEHIEFSEACPWPHSNSPGQPPRKKKNRPGQRAKKQNTNRSNRTVVLLVDDNTLQRILSIGGKKMIFYNLRDF